MTNTTTARITKPVTTLFTPFTEEDWFTYGGCESETPTIFNYEGGAVVIDCTEERSAVSCIYYDAEGEGREFFVNLPSAKAAQVIAEHVATRIAGENLSNSEIEEMLNDLDFESVMNDLDFESVM